MTSTHERRVEVAVLIAAALTVPAIALDQGSLAAQWRPVITILNWGIWLTFAAEAAIMLRVVPDRRKWLRDHPLDVAVLILTPPFAPAAIQASRAFRLLRLLRLVRAAGLTRRLLSTEGVRDAAVLALLSVLAGGAAYSAVEKSQHLSAWDGVWWAVTTVTTVGYGDESPKTDLGRVVAIVVMLVGIGFVAILTAAAADRFLARQRETTEAAMHDRLDEILARLDAIETRWLSEDVPEAHSVAEPAQHRAHRRPM